MKPIRRRAVWLGGPSPKDGNPQHELQQGEKKGQREMKNEERTTENEE
jgi:hypothetical protein